MASTTTTTRTTTKLRSRPSFSRALRQPSSSISNPDLGAAYVSHSRPPVPAIPRKASLAALTYSSLASIPDVSENYVLNSVFADPDHDAMVPTTPGRPSSDASIGDVVDVPGGMYGTVRFVGSVQGKGGIYAGVELNNEFASRGKNSGDVDGYVILFSSFVSLLIC